MNDIFQALGDPTRREVLRLLRQKPMTAGEISDAFELARSTMSGHLKLLRQAELIVAEKRGTTIVYSLNLSVAEQTLASVADLLGIRKRKKE